MTPLNPLELSFLTDVLPRLTLGLVAIALVGGLGAAADSRIAGHSWREIGWAAALKPDWWAGWYPARWRARADVWDRLPLDLRRGRTLVFFGFVACLLVLPALMMVSLNANNFYKLTGRETALVRVNRLLNKSRLVVPAIAMVPYGIGVLGLWFLYRWRRGAGSKVETKIAEGAFVRDTANRSFWSRPEVAALLLPEGSSSGRASSAGPATSLGFAEAISAIAYALPEPGRALGVKVRMAARQLADAVTLLDRQVAGLARAFDPAEARRLATRLADLGPDKGPTDENREIREILQKQLEPVTSLEARLENAKARRARRFELLQALWLHARELQADPGDSAKPASATGRIQQLLTQIGELDINAKTVGADNASVTEAISDAPTIER